MTRQGRLVGALGVVVALLVGACGQPTPTGTTPSPSSSGGTAPSATPSTSGAAGGELVVGLSAETESMDPYLVYQNAGNTIMFAVFDTLLTVAPDGSLGPGLATEWTVTDDTTIALTLRDDVTFHDGERFDATTVRSSIYRMQDRDPTTGEPLTDQTRLLNSGMRNDYASIESVDAVDPTHATLHLSRPDAALLSALGRLFMVPPKYLTEVGNADFAQRPVGTGPFRFVEWQKDDHSTFERNPDYWASPRGAPLVDRVTFRPLLDPPTRLNEFTTGGIGILQDAAFDDRPAIEDVGGELQFLDTDPHHVEIWMTADKGGDLANDPNAPAATKQAIEALAKPEVRRALNLAVDRQTVIDTLMGGLGSPMSHLFVNGELGFDPEIEPYRYDPEAAKQLLADAGYPDGLDITLDFCTCDKLDPIEAAIGDLADIGVRVTIKQLEISQFNAGWGKGTDPLRSARLGFHDPNTFLQLWFKSPAPDRFSLGRYSNPEMDALIDEQAVEYDAATRVDTLHRIGRLSHDDPAAIFLWSSPNLYATAATVVGWAPHYLGYLPVVNVSVTG
jgi:peptide/nickel transport system substrate-binding protein